jgi:hypothetical protein
MNSIPTIIGIKSQIPPFPRFAFLILHFELLLD